MATYWDNAPSEKSSKIMCDMMKAPTIMLFQSPLPPRSAEKDCFSKAGEPRVLCDPVHHYRCVSPQSRAQPRVLRAVVLAKLQREREI